LTINVCGHFAVSLRDLLTILMVISYLAKYVASKENISNKNVKNTSKNDYFEYLLAFSQP
jgi:hypothetical protein